MNFHPSAIPTLIALAIILGAAIYLAGKKKRK
jgi:LPXTG-motif cell wall-anchored protein